MAYFFNRFDGGTDGSQVTVANSSNGGNSALSYIFYNNGSFPSGNPNIVYSSTAAMSGSLGCRLTLGTSSTYIAYEDLSGAGDRSVTRFPIRFPSNPTATATIFVLRSSSGLMAQAIIRTTGQIRVADAATFQTASDFALSTNTVYWTEIAVTRGTTTSNGRIELRVFSADATTQVWSWDSGATLNTGTALPQVCRWPTATSSVGWSYVDLDDIQWDSNKSTGWLGAINNIPPSVSVSADKSTAFPGETVTLTATTTDSDGTIVSTGWSTTVGTLVGTGLTRTLAVPPSLTDQSATITFSATDDGGAQAQDTVTITLKASMSKMYDGTQWVPLIEYLIT